MKTKMTEMRIVLCWMLGMCVAMSTSHPLAEQPQSIQYVNQRVFSRRLENSTFSKRKGSPDTHEPFLQLATQLMRLGRGRIAITAGTSDMDWFPSFTHYPEGLYINGFDDQLQWVLGTLYDYFMIGTMEPERHKYPHMYYYPVHPCTPTYKRLANVLQLDTSDNLITKMLFSPFTLLLMDVDSTSVNVSYLFAERTVSQSIPIHLDFHQSVLDINMELGTLKIQYDGLNEGEAVLTVIQPVGITYLSQRIRSKNCVIRDISLTSVLIIHTLCYSPCEITIPFHTHPVLYSELPVNDRLGIILPPTQVHWIQSHQLMFSNRAVIITVAPDSTMRYDCIMVGTVALLLFSIQSYKRVISRP